MSNFIATSVWKTISVTVLVVFVTLVSGCDDTRQPTAVQASRPLVIGAFDKPKIINPILSNFGISAVLIDLIFDGLVKLDEKMSLEPGLAERWAVSEDGLTWTFYLRRGVTFHDGEPLTARDVKFTFDVIGNPNYINPHSNILSSIKEIVVLDPHTVRLDLKHPFPSIPYYLTFGVLPRRLYEDEDLRSTPMNSHPVGTGPYRLDSWSGDEILLKANQSYFLGKPRIEAISVKVFDTRMAAWAGLMRGRVDFNFFLEPKTIQVIEGLPHLRVYKVVHPYYNMMVFNHKRELFHDKAVRQAMNYAIDKARVIRVALNGAGVEVSCLAYPGSVYDVHDPLSYPHDPETASMLLAQAGWKDTDGDGVLERKGEEFRFTVLVPEGGFIPEKVAVLVQRELAEVGVRAEMTSLPLDQLAERLLKQKSFDAVLWSFGPVEDPDINHLFWSSTQIESGFNFSNYRNEDVDLLTEKGRRVADPGVRLETYLAFQRTIFEDPPGIFLYWRIEHFVLPESIKGVKVGPGGPFAQIYRWYYDDVRPGVYR